MSFSLAISRSFCAAAIAGGLWLLLSGAGSLRAQAPGTVDPVFGGPSLGLLGTVRQVVVQQDGKLLVAGGHNGIVRLNNDSTVDQSFQTVIKSESENYEMNIAVQPDGRIVVAGTFVQVNDSIIYDVVRLNADGTVDKSFRTDVFDTAYNTSVTSLALQPDGKIILGGQFQKVHGVAQKNIVRLNADGSLDTGFNASIDGFYSTFQFNAIAVQSDGKIVVGGVFSTVDGVARQIIARLNTDGSLDTGFASPFGSYSTLHAVAVQADGKILVGGYLLDFNNEQAAANCLTRLNPDGTKDTGFNPTMDDVVETVLTLPGGSMLVGGNFTTVNGASRQGLARLNANGSVDTGFTIGLERIVSGFYTQLVYSVAAQADGKIVLGGDFDAVNGLPRNSVGRVNADGSPDVNYVPDVSSGPNGDVSSLTLQTDGKIILTGNFSEVGGAARRQIARLNPGGGVDLGFSVQVDDLVNTAAVQTDGKIVLSGDFKHVDGVGRNTLARVNTDGSLDVGFNPSLDGSAGALVLANGGIVLECGSLQADGTTQDDLIRLRADGSQDTGFQSQSVGFVGAMVAQPDGRVLVATGQPFDGHGVRQIIRLNADGSLDTGFSALFVGDYNFVDVMAVQSDGKILLGGQINQFAGSPANPTGMARLNADGSVDPTFKAAFSVVNPYVDAIVVRPDGKIVIGGSFVEVDNEFHSHLAILNPDGSLEPFSNSGSGTDQAIYCLAVQSDGKVLLGGDFTSIDGVLRNYVARLTAGGAPDFLNGAQPVGGGFYYLRFPNGNPFGYYNVANFPVIYHVDMGFEYFIDAQDGHGGAYLYDFASNTFFYTSPTFPFPYLYDFSLQAFLYYYPDPTNPQRYNTNGVRYFFNFAMGKIITK